VTLIDTSAWIEFFRGPGSVADRVERALNDGNAALCGPVYTEVARGLRDAERQRVLGLFAGCHHLRQPHALWTYAGTLGQMLRIKGVTAKTLDLLIAAYALTHGCELLAADTDFRHMHEAGIPLRLS
jgi:predicted nucleic acid-binding protein